MKTSFHLALCLLLFSSCQSAREIHYFKEGENYYRIRVNEFALASKSRYMSGYYDEEAVDKYFGELKQPDSASIASKKRDDGQVTSLTAGNNTKLVLILSSNSNVVSEQISAIAENEQTLETLARLANKDKVRDKKEFDEKLMEVKRINSSIIGLGDIMLMTIDTNATDADRTILNFLTQLDGAITIEDAQTSNIRTAIEAYKK